MMKVQIESKIGKAMPSWGPSIGDLVATLGGQVGQVVSLCSEGRTDVLIYKGQLGEIITVLSIHLFPYYGTITLTSTPL